MRHATRNIILLASLSVALFGVTLLGSGSGAVNAAVAYADNLSWSMPELIDRQTHHGASIPLTAIACATTRLCVAVDQNGRVLTASAPFTRWNVAGIDDSNLLESVWCPTARLCFAVDDAGNVLWSRDPTAGVHAWHRNRIDASKSLVGMTEAGISCRSASFCVVAERGGQVLSSTRPTGPGLWHAVRLGYTPGGDLEGISCPSKSLCVVVDFSGDIWFSRHPTGLRSAWTEVANVPTPLSSLYSVSCASTSLCAAGNNLGSVIVTTNPRGGREAWPTFTVDGLSSNGLGYTITAIACSLPSLCAAVDNKGNVITSSNPTVGADAWHSQDIDDRIALTGISCPSLHLCVAADRAGQVIIGKG